MGRKAKSADPYVDINRKLDTLIAIQLSDRGFEKNDIAKILRVSEKTIQRMFAGKWNKLQTAGKEDNG
ncbi:MAG: hypothetical protein ACREA3_02190 [Nitrosotalea sp.]